MAFDIATEHVLHLADKVESFGTTATKHGRHLITAVSLHCQLSLAQLLQGMAVVDCASQVPSPTQNSRTVIRIVIRYAAPLQ